MTLVARRVARLERAGKCYLSLGDAFVMMGNGDMSALERLRPSDRCKLVAILEEAGRIARERDKATGTPTAESRHPG